MFKSYTLMILDDEIAFPHLDHPWAHIHQAHTLTPPPCPPLPPHCNDSINSRTVLIVGALHAVGAWLSVQLAGTSWTLRAITSDSDISTNQLLWYRRQQISNAGIEVKFLNFSNSSQLQSIVSLRPSHVVYVPPMLEHGATPPGSAYWGSHMTGFVSLLEGLTCAEFVMISQLLGTTPHHMTIQQAHMTSFEAALLTYHNLYGTRYTILRAGPVYGPWTEHSLSLVKSSANINESSFHSSSFISDITDAITSALSNRPFCDQLDINWRDSDADSHINSSPLNLTSLQPVSRGIRKTIRWARDYQRQLQLSKNDVILTSYFTSREDFQRNKSVSPNRARYLFNWLVSVRDLGLTAVVFHDQLDPGFCQRIMEYHPGVSFRRVATPLNHTTNDARFYSYLEYLHTRLDVGRVLMTDISDVRFQRNPFELMQLLGDWFYIGTDIDIFPNMASQRWISERLEGCFGNHTLLRGPLKPLMHKDTVYNAGVIGGTRPVILAFLETLVQYLNSAPPNLNCNMPAVNFVVHKHFYQQVFTGFPLTSRFLSFQSSPKAIYIVHK